MVTRREAIANFLGASTSPLKHLYTPSMEVQVNVARDGGDAVEGEFKGRIWRGWTNSVETWKPFRIPLNANGEANYTDSNMTYDLAAHVEGIGLTGWDYENKVSKWVAFDFDGLIGHSEKHSAKLTPEELQYVRDSATSIPWVTVRRSTSGSGLHLYVMLDNIPTENHTEHAALGRAILSHMSTLVNFDFEAKVDTCGGNMWIWHRKMLRSTNSFELIKEGEQLLSEPQGWREHIDVIRGRRRKHTPSVIHDSELDDFDKIMSQRIVRKLSEKQQEHIKWLQENAYCIIYKERNMITTHTWHIKGLHESCNMLGTFETVAEGKHAPTDVNCFMFPGPNDSWEIRRFGQGAQEARTWDQDPGGWTRCWLNVRPTLEIAAFLKGGAELPNGSFQFAQAELAMLAAKEIGVNIDIPQACMTVMAWLKPHKKDNKLTCELARIDNYSVTNGWVESKDKYVKVFRIPGSSNYEPEIVSYDEQVRHLVSEIDNDCGWVINSENRWRFEPLSHVKTVLGNLNIDQDVKTKVIGSCVLKPWILVNKPFEDEYLSNRRWNRRGARLKFKRSNNDDPKTPNWDKIINHVAGELDRYVIKHPWCNQNGITTGAEYLQCWIASLIQYPLEPLPYLFLFGPQNSGKSILHEALSILISRGICRADSAILNNANFNGELENSVLCIIEETNLNDNKHAYERIKDWVTSKTIMIHKKFEQPYDMPNSTHWIQCSNDKNAIKMFPGDTRINMIYVPELDEMARVPKRKLMPMLEAEAPDFIERMLSLTIPDCNDRLRIPVIETADKTVISQSNQSALEEFINDQYVYAPGYEVRLSEFTENFKAYLDNAECALWTARRIGRELPREFVKGRSPQTNQVMIGNIAARDTIIEPRSKFVLQGEKLVREGK